MPKGAIRPLKLDTSGYRKAQGREPGGRGEFRFRNETSGEVWPKPVPGRGNYVEMCTRLRDEVARGAVPGGRWRVEPPR